MFADVTHEVKRLKSSLAASEGAKTEAGLLSEIAAPSRIV